MEAFDERSGFLDNPKRLLRCALEMGRGAIIGVLDRVDESMDIDWDNLSD